MTALHYACLKAENKDMVKYIIEHYPSLQHVRNKCGATELHYAAVGGSVDVLRYLVRIGYDVHSADNQGMTALHYVCGKGRYVEVVKYLVVEVS